MQHLVVKLGGAAVDDQDAAAQVFSEIKGCVERGVRVVVVHGGGQRLTKLCERFGLEPHFIGGRRVTDKATLDVAKLALAGAVSTDLAAVGRRVGLPLVGLSGVSAGLIAAVKRPAKTVRDPDGVDVVLDFGEVGDVTGVNTQLLTTLLGGGFVPLVSTLGADDLGRILNINADTVAGKIAAALPGGQLILLTDVDGVRRDPHDPDTRIPRLSLAEATALSAAVQGGMRPKLESAAACLAAGAARVHIASWRRHGVLAACLSGRDGGTLVVS